MSSPAIAFREVSRSFGGRAVLNKVSFEVAQGKLSACWDEAEWVRASLLN
jgi:hypothetical protein